MELVAAQLKSDGMALTSMEAEAGALRFFDSSGGGDLSGSTWPSVAELAAYAC